MEPIIFVKSLLVKICDPLTQESKFTSAVPHLSTLFKLSIYDRDVQTVIRKPHAAIFIKKSDW